MFEIGSRAQKLPAPPSIVFGSLANPQDPRARPWLVLLDDEVEPRILYAAPPDRVVWSSLWPHRPDDTIIFDLALADPATTDTLLRFTHVTPDEPPSESTIGHLRKRLNVLLFADLRFSYGQ